MIIIGAGPAGLTAGLYAARARMKVLLIDGLSVPSQATVTAFVENYPGFPEGVGGIELIEKMKKQIVNLGIDFLNADVESIVRDNNNTWKVKLDDKHLEAISLIIATGARPRELGISGEQKFKGRGVSYCAVCDAAFFKGKDIVVVGGGDTAIEETIFLTKFVNSIKVIHRRGSLRATKILQERAFNNKKIEFVWDSVAKEITGADKVDGIVVLNLKTNEKFKIPCNGVFVFVGYLPNTDFVKGVVDLDLDGHILTDSDMHTSAEGVFACGDCRRKLLRQIITACGDGATAAFQARHYIEKMTNPAP